MYTRCSKKSDAKIQSVSIGWSNVTVIYGHDTISILYGMMSYCGKLTGEDLSRYLNETESLGLRKG